MEADFTKWEADSKQISLWGSVMGHRASSTRTELAAGCVAATAPGGMHQATDSKAYCDLANAIINNRRPDDADLGR